jgi:hypothetical protein
LWQTWKFLESGAGKSWECRWHLVVKCNSRMLSPHFIGSPRLQCLSVAKKDHYQLTWIQKLTSQDLPMRIHVIEVVGARYRLLLTSRTVFDIMRMEPTLVLVVWQL